MKREQEASVKTNIRSKRPDNEIAEHLHNRMNERITKGRQGD